jgi:hypothetical protein
VGKKQLATVGGNVNWFGVMAQACSELQQQHYAVMDEKTKTTHWEGVRRERNEIM